MKEFQKQCRFTLLFSFLLSINLIAQNDTLSLLLDRKIANRDFNFSPDLWKSADFQQEIPKRMVKLASIYFNSHIRLEMIITMPYTKYMKLFKIKKIEYSY